MLLYALNAKIQAKKILLIISLALFSVIIVKSNDLTNENEHNLSFEQKIAILKKVNADLTAYYYPNIVEVEEFIRKTNILYKQAFEQITDLYVLDYILQNRSSFFNLEKKLTDIFKSVPYKTHKIGSLTYASSDPFYDFVTSSKETKKHRGESYRSSIAKFLLMTLVSKSQQIKIENKYRNSTKSQQNIEIELYEMLVFFNETLKKSKSNENPRIFYDYALEFLAEIHTFLLKSTHTNTPIRAVNSLVFEIAIKLNFLIYTSNDKKDYNPDKSTLADSKDYSERKEIGFYNRYSFEQTIRTIAIYNIGYDSKPGKKHAQYKISARPQAELLGLIFSENIVDFATAIKIASLIKFSKENRQRFISHLKNNPHKIITLKIIDPNFAEIIGFKLSNEELQAIKDIFEQNKQQISNRNIKFYLIYLQLFPSLRGFTNSITTPTQNGLIDLEKASQLTEESMANLFNNSEKITLNNESYFRDALLIPTSLRNLFYQLVNDGNVPEVVFYIDLLHKEKLFENLFSYFDEFTTRAFLKLFTRLAKSKTSTANSSGVLFLAKLLVKKNIENNSHSLGAISILLKNNNPELQLLALKTFATKTGYYIDESFTEDKSTQSFLTKKQVQKVLKIIQKQKSIDYTFADLYEEYVETIKENNPQKEELSSFVSTKYKIKAKSSTSTREKKPLLQIIHARASEALNMLSFKARNFKNKSDIAQLESYNTYEKLISIKETNPKIYHQALVHFKNKYSIKKITPKSFFYFFGSKNEPSVDIQYLYFLAIEYEEKNADITSWKDLSVFFLEIYSLIFYRDFEKNQPAFSRTLMLMLCNLLKNNLERTNNFKNDAFKKAINYFALVSFRLVNKAPNLVYREAETINHPILAFHDILIKVAEKYNEIKLAPSSELLNEIQEVLKLNNYISSMMIFQSLLLYNYQPKKGSFTELLMSTCKNNPILATALKLLNPKLATSLLKLYPNEQVFNISTNESVAIKILYDHENTRTIIATEETLKLFLLHAFLFGTQAYIDLYKGNPKANLFTNISNSAGRSYLAFDGLNASEISEQQELPINYDLYNKKNPFTDYTQALITILNSAVTPENIFYIKIAAKTKLLHHIQDSQLLNSLIFFTESIMAKNGSSSQHKEFIINLLNICLSNTKNIKTNMILLNTFATKLPFEVKKILLKMIEKLSLDAIVLNNAVLELKNDNKLKNKILETLKLIGLDYQFLSDETKQKLVSLFDLNEQDIKSLRTTEVTSTFKPKGICLSLLSP